MIIFKDRYSVSDNKYLQNLEQVEKELEVVRALGTF